MPRPQISFVIPAYNEEAYLTDCLTALTDELGRGDCLAEIIVVNNASTDRTKELAAACPGVQVVDEPRKGLVQARQAGYLASRGELIANIDADAIIPAGWIDQVIEAFRADPTLVALSGPYVYYDLPWLTNLLTKFYYGLGYLLHLVNHHLLKKGAMLQGGNFVLRRRALERINGYDTKLEFYGEDTDIARRIQAVGRVCFTFKLKMYTSGRRLAKEGLIAMGWKYGINHLWMLLFKRPFTKNYIDVR